jgi:inhibitor of KinA sporulation pathway (predicted exonuclease)
MKYIILDLEATCWEQKGHGNKNEIIEIGALCINDDGKIESEFSEFIKPTLNPILSDFCKSLTSIKQEDVDYADKFDKVIERFKSWIGDNDYVLCSWGFYDKTQFESDCNIHKLDTKWLRNHISLKHQYTGIKGLKKHIGMSGALALEKLMLEGTHHRGIDDARNIAKIFVKQFNNWKFNV